MNDYESLTNNQITQTVIFPSYNRKFTYLSGIKLGVSPNSDRAPYCTRVALEYIGKHTSIIKCLKNCMLYDENDQRIKAEVFDIIGNDHTSMHHFEARNVSALFWMAL